ncbi:MAG: hypothetical protein VX044_08260 [Planctomycetota bacterium]|nr:hypothetical protein [Planctomycetota bacterium]
MRAALLGLVTAACAAPSPEVSPRDVGIRVVGDGQAGVVLECRERLVGAPLDRPQRVADAAGWRALCASVAGEMAPAGARPPVSFEATYLVAVPIAGGMRCRGVVVSSEEGVDVVTIDVERQVAMARRAPRVAMLQLKRRPNQVAVVVRDEAQGAERTVLIYSPG